MHAVLGVRQYCKVHMKIWIIQKGFIFIFLRIFEVHRSRKKCQWKSSKKKCIRAGFVADLGQSAGPRPASPAARGRGVWPSWPRGPAVSRWGSRSGTGRRRPSDLNKIDGPASSPSSGCGKQEGNPSWVQAGAATLLGAVSGLGKATRGRGALGRVRRWAEQPDLAARKMNSWPRRRGCFGAPRWLLLWHPWVTRRVGLGSYCLQERMQAEI
jgi:hypothetical protein